MPKAERIEGCLINFKGSGVIDADPFIFGSRVKARIDLWFLKD